MEEAYESTPWKRLVVAKMILQQKIASIDQNVLKETMIRHLKNPSAERLDSSSQTLIQNQRALQALVSASTCGDSMQEIPGMIVMEGFLYWTAIEQASPFVYVLKKNVWVPLSYAASYILCSSGSNFLG